MVIMNNVNTTEKLIQEVRARPALWDQRSLNYHNRVVVNALWQDIADVLQINKEIVKVKWKGLRDTYRRELKKQRSNANATFSENVRDPSWTHYSSMNFLREYMGNNNNNNNNNHNDIFQFHGWSTEEFGSADEMSSINEESVSAAMLTPSVRLTDLTDSNSAAATSGAAATGSSKSSDSSASSDDETNIRFVVKTKAAGNDQTKPKSPGEPVNAPSILQFDSTNHKVSATTAATFAATTSTKKSKTGDKKRSSTTVARYSRMKEQQRLRTKMSKKHVRARHHHSPTTTIHHHPTTPQATDIDHTVPPVVTVLANHNGASHPVASNAPADELDDDLYFFKSLIPFVKNLPPTRKLYLRAEIHNLVLRELMSDGSPNSVIPLEHVAVGLNA